MFIKESEDSVPGITWNPPERQGPELQPQERLGLGQGCALNPGRQGQHFRVRTHDGEETQAREPGRSDVDRSLPCDPAEALSSPICKWTCQAHLGLGLQEGQRQQKLGCEGWGWGGGIKGKWGCSLVIRTFELQKS